MRPSRISAVQGLSSAIAIAICSVLVSSCSFGAATGDTKSQNDSAQSGASTTSVPEIDLSAPVTFNPKDPNFRIADPCADIPEEVLREAGLGQRSKITNPPNANYRACGFEIESGERFKNAVHLGVNLGNLEKVRRMSEIHSESVASEIPGVYQYHSMGAPNEECASVAQTSGGQFDVSFKDHNKQMSEEQICAESLALLEKFYPIVEGKLRNGSARS